MASRLQDVILRGLAADRPAAADVAPGTLYYSTDTATTDRCSDDGTTWETYADSAGLPAAHASTHYAAGSDPVDVTLLDGFPGGATTFLRDDGTFAAPAVTAVRKQITVVLNGGGVAITTGLKGFLSLPVSGTWKKWRILSVDAAVTSGSIVFDVWKDTYANYPPTVADTITASDKPTLSAATKAEGTALTGWTTAFTAGDVLGINVDSVSTVTEISFTLEYE